MVSQWKLPSIVGESIKFHHNPIKSSQNLIVSSVYVANKITQEQLTYPVLDQEIGESLDFEIPDPEEFRKRIFLNIHINHQCFLIS